MLLNFAAPRIAPNIVTAPKSNLDINAILGLAPSQYEGLQKVGDTGYYYGDNKMYEPYTPSPVSYGRMIMGQWSPVNYTPSYSPFFGYGGGLSARGGAVEGTITRGDQSFKPVDVDVTGFSKSKIEDSDLYEYSPSMAYVYSQAPKPTYQPTPSQTSFLSSPTPSVSYNGNYGAGRFLNTGNLLGFNFGTPSGQTTGGQATT